MIAKQTIVAALGETRLALPRLVDDALAANDRFKYRLTLLQLAKRHADAPDAGVPSLTEERLRARIEDPVLDELPSRCEQLPDGRYRLPGLPTLLAAAADEIDAMAAAVEASEPWIGGEERAAFRARADALLPGLRDVAETFGATDVDAWSHADAARGDSPHRLVMDLHKALNRIQRGLATELVDGASVYGLAPGDRERVAAFMRGVRRTSPLRFDHPGLGTTATRSAERLVIQNDIGTTDAHVLVVTVREREVTVTYTDVHLQRLLFFQALFRHRATTWTDTRLVQDRRMEEGLYHLGVGTFVAADEAALRDCLEFLGSRLVFLIDWNRARKQLRLLVGKKEAVRLLERAAEHDHGHMAFLRIGGARAVYDALDFVARGRAHFGQSLADVLGEERAERYLEFVLRTAAVELLAGRPESLVVDELRAELARLVRGAGEGLLDLAAEHAALVTEIADAVAAALAALSLPDGQARAEALAARCKRWESEADRLLVAAREAASAAPEAAYLRELVERADDVADDLEEAAFLVTLLRPAGVDGALRAPLAALAAELRVGTQELVKAVETLRVLVPGASREDLREFLEAIHRIGRVEHDTDAGKRRVATRLAERPLEARTIHVAAESAACLELAADHLLHAALGLRDRVLERVSRH